MPKATKAPKAPAKTAAKTAPKQKPVVDKKGLKLIKKVAKSVRKFQKHVGTHRDNIRAKHAKDLLEIINEMVKDEKDGWLDLD
jgi:hypothetical protein